MLKRDTETDAVLPSVSPVGRASSGLGANETLRHLFLKFLYIYFFIIFSKRFIKVVSYCLTW
nr:MAG TPA: hypothetical protein [Caudoviricetes sp.]